MSSEIAHRTSDTLNEQMEWSKAMSTGDMLPKQYRGNPANLMFACEYADALGIPRINALTSINIIDGKPSASAELIASLVRKAGHKLRVEGDDTYAEATIIRADDPDYVPTPVRWDAGKAKQAGKWGSKGPWSQYPAAMLRARAVTEAARMWASDALYGVVYTPEELGAVVDEDGELQHRPSRRVPQGGRTPDVPHHKSSSDVLAQAAAEPVPEPEPETQWDMESLHAMVDGAGTLDELQGVWKETLETLPASQAREFNRIVTARKQELQQEPTDAEAEATLTDALDAEVVEE